MKIKLVTVVFSHTVEMPEDFDQNNQEHIDQVHADAYDHIVRNPHDFDITDVQDDEE